MKRLFLSLICAIAAPTFACGGARRESTAASSARTVALSVHGLDCAECSAEIVAELKKVPGVRGVAFDKVRVVFTVSADPSVRTDDLLSAVKRAGAYTVDVGDAGGSYLPSVVFPAGAVVDEPVKDGSDVEDLATLAVPGKVTVVDLFAGWCGPCRSVDEHMRDVLSARTDVAYRKLDIVDWSSPLAKHQMNGVPFLPYVLVFDRHRKKVDAISGVDLKRLDIAIASAGANP